MSNRVPNWMALTPNTRSYRAISATLDRYKRAKKRLGNSPSTPVPRHLIPPRLAHALRGESLIQVILTLMRAGMNRGPAEKVAKNLKRISNANSNRR